MDPGSCLMVYLDTSGWNALCDWSDGRSLTTLRGPEYLFSSCDLDEFGLAPPARAKELAAFAWRLSNRRKLFDHVELTAAEVTAYQTGCDVELFDADPGFFLAWQSLRTGGLPTAMRDSIAGTMESVKASYRDFLSLSRKLFGPFFRALSTVGPTPQWSVVLQDFERGPEIGTMIESALAEAGLLDRLPEPEELRSVPYDALPATACWVQYHIALNYLAAFESARLGHPEKGDQVDFRHVCYAGICDVFVTGDARMNEILRTMVRSRKARVLKPGEYLEEMTAL